MNRLNKILVQQVFASVLISVVILCFWDIHIHSTFTLQCILISSRPCFYCNNCIYLSKFILVLTELFFILLNLHSKLYLNKSPKLQRIAKRCSFLFKRYYSTMQFMLLSFGTPQPIPILYAVDCTIESFTKLLRQLVTHI